MIKLKWYVLLTCLTIIVSVGDMTWGQCVADGNDTATAATLIGYTDTVTDVVCPDIDLFDYFAFAIAAAAEASGTITLDSPQTGTTMKISGPDGDIFVNGTTDASHTLAYTIPAGGLGEGIYYIRTGFYSSYTFDHDYTLTLALVVSGGSDCVADNNEDAAHAVALSFGSTVSDWVCAADHLDIWRFTVASNPQGAGSVTLTAAPGELVLYLYDSASTELYRGTSSDGSLKYNLDSAGTALAPGEYYIGVLLPPARSDQNSYTLKLEEKAETLVLPGQFGVYERVEPQPQPEITLPAGPMQVRKPRVPWPCSRGNRANNGRSYLPGPIVRQELDFVTIDFDLSVNDVKNNHKYYSGLLVGKDNWVYCLKHPAKELLAFHIPDTDVKWSHETGTAKSACLDDEGNIYYIHKNGRDIVCADGKTGDDKWKRAITESGSKSVELAGEFIYVARVNYETQTSYIHVYTKPGIRTNIWGPLDGSLVGVAEDTDKHFVYVQTGKRLYQIFWMGNVTWNKQYPVFENRPPGITGAIKPVINNNGEIWSYDAGTMKYYVYNSSGEKQLEGAFEKAPQAVCLGADGRFYVACEDKITCFTNWNTLQWQKSENFNEGTYACDFWAAAIILDSNSNLYNCYYRNWYFPGSDQEPDLMCFIELLNTDDIADIHASTRNQAGDPDSGLDADLIEFVMDEKPPNGGVEMAIGEGNKLVILHLVGRLQVRMPEG